MNCSIICMEWIKIGITALTPLSIFIAFLAYRTNSKKNVEDKLRERDKEYVSQLTRSWEWAYGALTENGKLIPPPPDRLNWLTTARHLLGAERLHKQITHPTYQLIAAEHEEYWRHRFNLALAHNSLREAAYFLNRDTPAWPENIEISSALVVVNFSNWKKGRHDPVDDVDRDHLVNTESGIEGGGAGRGLRAYMVRLSELQDRR